MAPQRKHVVPSLLISIFLIGLLGGTAFYVEGSNDVPDIRFAATAFDKTAIDEHLKALTQFQSKMTGYPGFFEATEYIVSRFEEYGVVPYGLDEEYFEYYDVTVPFDYGASITLEDGTVLKAFNLWPNDVNTSPYVSPPEGDTIVYVGRGDYLDYENVDVEGKFVFARFDSLWHFRIASLHGAKGIVYWEQEISRTEAFQKSYDLPIDFPKLYLKQDEAASLLAAFQKEEEVKIHVDSSMAWEQIRVPNIVGYVEGTTWPNEAIVVAAYYDSWSIVPALSPGGSDAVGISVLLDFARFLTENPPERSVILVALSGHYQSLWGSREFVDRHFGQLASTMKGFANLNLVTESSQLGIYSTGSTYPFRNLAGLNNRYTWLVRKFFDEYLPELQKEFGNDYGRDFADRILLTHPRYVQNSPNVDFVGTYAFDSEPYTLACFGGGFSYHTTNALRLYQRTPFDTYDRLNLENLWPQASFVFGTLWGLLKEPAISLQQDPARVGPQDWGYFTITVQVTEYNVRTAFWDAFTLDRHPDEWKDVAVHFKVNPNPQYSVYGTGGTTYPGGYFLIGGIDLVLHPNENGEVTIKGMKPYEMATVTAFVVNSTNGRIEWATDLGTYQALPKYPIRSGRLVYFASQYDRALISIFPCGNLKGFFLYNPIDFTVIQDILLYHHVSHGPLIRESFLISRYGDFMAFVEPDIPVEIIVPPVSVGALTTQTSGPASSFALAVFLNATEENPDGFGYVVERGESSSILETPLEAAQNLYLMNDQRVQTLSSFNTYNPALIFFHSLAEESLNKALTYRDNGMLGSVYGEAFSAWALEQRAYSLTRSYTFEIMDVTTFLFFLVVPFAFFLERLLLSRTGIFRILGVFGIFCLLIIGVGLFHPGFSIATNVSMVLMAFAIVVLILPVLGFIIGEAVSSIKIVRTALMGVHTIDISRGGAITQAFSTGIESIKKRKSRSLLTIISITLIVFALVTFTSITTIPAPLQIPVRESPLYQGLVVRQQPWGALPEEIYRNLVVKYKDKAAVAPRGWWLAQTVGQAGGEAYFVFTPDRLTQIGSLLFLSPDEADVTGVDNLLVDGRWFVDSDLYACIISREVADSLTEELGREITLRTQVPLWGMNLTVVGLFEADQFDALKDLDGEPLTPLMPVIDWIRQSPPPHFPAKNILIVPFALGMQMRDIIQVMSVGVKPFNPEDISQTAVDLALRTVWDVFVGEGNGVRIVRARSLFSIIGGTYFLIPLVICALVIFNVTLSSVYERTSYIRVYTSVGLSPTHVAGMFFAESFVYAIVGAVFGYLLGIIGCNVFGDLGLYPPGFYPNFSSYFVLIVLGISAAVSIIATIYPANIAWKLVTPSLSRKWSLKGPVGDEWQVPFPFVATEKETKAIFLFLKEFFEVGSKEVTMFEAREVTIDMSRMELRAMVQLAPFEAGVHQEMIIKRIGAGEDKFTFNLLLRKTEGYLSTWKASNKNFIDNIRKQFLVWRALSSGQKERYQKLSERG